MNRISEKELFEIESQIQAIKITPSDCVEQLRQLRIEMSTMIHDCRSHLSVILCSAELLEHYGHRLNDEARLERLHHIQEAVTRIAEIMDVVRGKGR